ncbi:MAG: hypothetical protein R2788_27360 [Saprospiraceae bacterium]
MSERVGRQWMERAQHQLNHNKQLKMLDYSTEEGKPNCWNGPRGQMP